MLMKRNGVIETEVDMWQGTTAERGRKAEGQEGKRNRSIMGSRPGWPVRISPERDTLSRIGYRQSSVRGRAELRLCIIANLKPQIWNGQGQREAL
jgi:hypothetical protein